MTRESAREAQPLWRAALAVFARAAPVLLLIGVAVAAYASGITHDLEPGALHAHEQALRLQIADHPVLFVAGFMAVYALLTAAFVPVGIPLMLAAGFLLGPWLGGVISITASTIAAFLAYFAARFAVGDLLKRRMGEGKLAAIIRGFDANAFSYMLTLRLIPLSPFGLVNIAAGVARAPLVPYLAATVIGDVPTSFIYTHLGAGLGEVFLRGGKPDLAVMTRPDVVIPLIFLALISLATVAYGRWVHRR